MKTTLEKFIDSHVLSPMSSIEFVADFPRRREKRRIVHEIYGSEAKEIRVADSLDELLDIFAPDDDVETLRSILSMSHVIGVEFNMYGGTFNVSACVATEPDDDRSPYVIVSASSNWHRVAPLYALRRQITIDSTPISVWRSIMRYRGHDVRLIRRDGAFSVLVYDIDDDDDDRKPKIETHGKSPYEALARWQAFVSDAAADQFENADS